jgi:hypothetical protein
MKKTKEKLVLQIDDIICDICGASCRKTCDIESAKLFAHWGYDSKRDGDVFDIDICESCFEKILKYMLEIRSCISKREEDNQDTLTPTHKFN